MANKVVITKVPSNKVTVQESNATVQVTEEVVKVTSIGIQGPPGGGDKHYVHNQSIPRATWTVTHNMQKRPAVISVDTADRQIVGAVEYIDDNILTIEFSGAVAGKAYLN